MSLKNYSTEIPLERTITEIENLLIQHGATHILKDYDTSKNIISINFMICVQTKLMPIKLPLDINAVQQLLKEQKKAGEVKGLSNAQINDIARIRKIGWRFLKDWLQAQMDYIDLKQRKIEQIFLADIYDSVKNKTLFEILQERKFAGLLLESTTVHQ